MTENEIYDIAEVFSRSRRYYCCDRLAVEMICTHFLKSLIESYDIRLKDGAQPPQLQSKRTFLRTDSPEDLFGI